jgi:hypothetical protein
MIKKIFQVFLVFSLLNAIPTYGQTVSISNLRYTNGALIPNGSAIEIYEGGSKSVTFDLKIDNPQALSIKGYLYVKSKKSSSASSSLEYVNVDFNNNKLSTWYSKEFTISLNASNFNATGGNLYGQFSVTSSSGGVIMGNIIPIKVVPVPVIQNNTIALNGSTIYGSIPAGGTGTYTYRWLIYALEGEVPSIAVETTKDYIVPASLYYWTTINNVYIERQVSSGSKTSISNYILLSPVVKRSALTTESLTTTDFKIYPNPTSESVNFVTDHSSDKEIEITVYSEVFKGVKSVFKGIVLPNQVIKWDIPSNYQKGIYYYKILSDKEEIKSGKILYQ